VRPDGVLVWYGRSSRTPAEIPTDWFMTHSEARIIPLFVFTEVDSRRIGTSDLAHLMSLVESGQLDPQVTVTADWTSANDVVTDLLERRVIGKATLTFS
jgi:NADPH:quinone reductase-like Zn-dependent oxidoreductase